MERPEGLPTIFTARPAASVQYQKRSAAAAAAANGMATTASTTAIAEWRARIFLMLSSIYDKRYPKRHYFTKKWTK